MCVWLLMAMIFLVAELPPLISKEDIRNANSVWTVSIGPFNRCYITRFYILFCLFPYPVKKYGYIQVVTSSVICGLV